MSYIRSTSNPEGLYIWNDGKEIWFSSSLNLRRSNPGKKKFNPHLATISVKEWKGFAKEYTKTGGYVNFSFGSISVVHDSIISKKTGRIMSDSPSRSPGSYDLRSVFSFHDTSSDLKLWISLYPVTFHYFMRDA